MWLIGILVGSIEVVGRFALATLMSFQGEPIGVLDGEWYRIVTGGFLHAGLIHLGFNMLALAVFGVAAAAEQLPEVPDAMPLTGPAEGAAEGTPARPMP